MAVPFILPLRIVQAALAIIILGLTAYVVDTTWGFWNSVNFMLFTSIWTLLTVAFLVLTPTHFPALAHKYIILAAEALCMIFWFAAWVAVAALWGDLRCGSHSGTCGAGTAAIVFGAIEWLTFVATTVMAALHVYRTPRSDPKPDVQMEVQGV